MKNLTPKQLQKLESQIDLLSSKLDKVFKEFKVSEKKDELFNENFCDWDAQTQEGMINELGNLEFTLSNLSSRINDLRN